MSARERQLNNLINEKIARLSKLKKCGGKEWSVEIAVLEQEIDSLTDTLIDECGGNVNE